MRGPPPKIAEPHWHGDLVFVKELTQKVPGIDVRRTAIVWQAEKSGAYVLHCFSEPADFSGRTDIERGTCSIYRLFDDAWWYARAHCDEHRRRV